MCLAFVIYVIAFNAYYGRFFITVGQSVSISPINLSSTEMLYSIERIERVRRHGQEVYALTGWAFPEDGQLSSREYDKQVVLLAENGDAHVFDAQTRERKDVAAAFPNPEGDESSSGFLSYVSAYSLRRGDYRVGLLYAEEDGSSIYTLTRWFARRTPNTLGFTPFRPPVADPLGELRLRTSVARGMQPISQVSCGIDWLREVEREAEGIYELSGWCFSENTGLRMEHFQRHIMLMDARSRMYLLAARTVVRPDLTEAFSELGRDLDLSGFSVDIPFEQLEGGLHRLGIAWTDGLSAPAYYLTYFYVERTSSGLQLGHPPPG
ncbi:MAG: hypothetical protein WD906_07625 [Anaerolineales bacterium]